MKRLLDLFVSISCLLIFSPIILIAMLAVWLQDYKNPFYVAPRVGKGNKIFKMYKLRSMVVNADKSGVDSTSANDMRITKVGHIIRKFKLDELTQLINVVLGDMSLVGPRPNVQVDVNKYTDVELRLLSVRPGITDLASIVFADEGDILKDSADPNEDYDKLIRPWKSRLALFSIDNSSVFFDLKICFLTALTIFSRRRALDEVVKILQKNNAEAECIKVAARTQPLVPSLPPGYTREVNV